MPGDAGDVVLMIGTEPQLRWRTFCDQVASRRPRARLPPRASRSAPSLAEVPHTRPVPVIGTAVDPDVIERSSACSRSTYEGPTGIVGVLPGRLPRGRPAAPRRCGRPSPPTCPAAPSPKAALALVERTAELLERVGAHHRPRDRLRRLRAPGDRAGRARTTRPPSTSRSSRSATTPTPTTAPSRARWSRRSSASSATDPTEPPLVGSGSSRIGRVARPGPDLLADAGQAQRHLVGVAAGHDLQADRQAVDGRRPPAPTPPGSSTGWPAW